MKLFFPLICAAALSGASFGAQSAPVTENQRVAQELLRLAEQRRAAGDEAVARALTAQAGSLMQGQHEVPMVGELPVLGAHFQPVETAELAELETARLAYSESGLHALALATLAPQEELNWQGLELAQMEGLQALQSLGYLDTMPQQQDDVHATLREIRQELQALRAEVGALRAEMARPRSPNAFPGGMTAPAHPGEHAPGSFYFQAPQGQQQGFYHVPAPSGGGQQPEIYYYQQGGAPSAPMHPAPAFGGGAGGGPGGGLGGDAGPGGPQQGSWQWVPAVPGQPAPHNSAPVAPAQGGAWQRHHAQAAAAADAERTAQVRTEAAQQAAGMAAQEAHAAAVSAWHDAVVQSLHGNASAGAAAAPSAVAAPAAPAPPAPPAPPATPRSGSRTGGSRQQY